MHPFCYKTEPHAAVKRSGASFIHIIGRTYIDCVRLTYCRSAALCVSRERYRGPIEGRIIYCN